ncbi:MAG TPA: RHS repeat-associated core domain-containing protein, partial [Candidatus Methylacidiphilales bacterium]|nr:RHS repeat-associated core domain-containing protein [Candidatus Methylacidiphilales bacterium]
GACPFGFAGMLMDATTGLYYDNARWYSAPQGRFLTPDPSGAAGGLNLEAYCGNDPVNLNDLTGLGGSPVSCLECHSSESIQTTDQSPHLPLSATGGSTGGEVIAWLRGQPLTSGPPGGQWTGVDATGPWRWQPGLGRVYSLVVCHGHDGDGPIGGLSLTDHYFGGLWVQSGSNGDIARNYSAGMVSFPAMLGQGLVNVISSPFGEGTMRDRIENGPFGNIFENDAAIEKTIGTPAQHTSTLVGAGQAGGMQLMIAGIGCVLPEPVVGPVAVPAGAAFDTVGESLGFATGGNNISLSLADGGTGATNVAESGSLALRAAVDQPTGGNGIVLRDGAGATAAEIQASTEGPTAGNRVGQASVRRQLISEQLAANNGKLECWRCGISGKNPADFHLGHRNVPTSLGGNLEPVNVAPECASCNLSAGNRGAPSLNMSGAERGSPGAPYGR